MKKYAVSILLSLVILSETSCTKDNSTAPVSPRTITFILYTKKDFSTDEQNISFSIFIKNHVATLFDSTLSTIKIKDIPGPANRLVIVKKVPNDDGSLLSAGFLYNIENVGYSWHLDTCAAGQSSKIIEFSFQ